MVIRKNECAFYVRLTVYVNFSDSRGTASAEHLPDAEPESATRDYLPVGTTAMTLTQENSMPASERTMERLLEFTFLFSPSA